MLTRTGSACGAGGGAEYDWKQQTDTFSVNALTPTTTLPIWIKSTATSSFAGGVESWGKIAAPYFNATSTTATSTFQGGLSLTDGAFRHYTSGVTEIDNLNLGNLAFDTNAGWVTWIDLPINSSAPSGTSEAYSATINGEQVFTVYGEANGSGVITKTRAVVGTTTAAVLTSANIPYGSLIVSDGALCVDDGGATNCDDGALTRGNIYAESSSIGLIDLAENYPTKEEDLVAGELVMLDQENPVFVKRYTTLPDGTPPLQGGDEGVVGGGVATSSAPTLLGVISTAPGVLLGGFGNALYAEENKVPVVLAGRVPVKVNGEGGAIAIGDRLAPSSVAGIAAKATTTGWTVGVALEVFSGEGESSIITFIDRQFNLVGEDLSGIEGLIASSTAAFAESSSFIEKLMAKVLDYLASLGTRIAQGLTQVKKLVVDDELCIGNTCVNEAQLAALLQGTTPPDGTPPQGGGDEGVVGPTILIQGNNPAEVLVGATYADLGVLVTDDKDQNLGVAYYVDGVKVSEISLDTSTTTTYTIDYVATDNDGNTATSTRTVIVGNQQPTPEPTPTPEPNPEPTPEPETPPTETASSTPPVSGPEPTPSPEPTQTAESSTEPAI